MTRVALIDADIVAYRCSASAEEESLDIALERADMLMERICNEIRADAHEAYLTGSESFREVINPNYKANRKDKPKPRWLQPVREHLVTGWRARITNGNEADDELGISQCTTPDDTIICTIDKDLLQIPGEHFNFVTGERRMISPHEGHQNFYFQMIMGDTSDNIYGFDGVRRSKVPKFLEPTIAYLMDMETERDMFEFVYGLYEEHTREAEFEINAQCLYIQKSIGDKWHEPKENVILLSNQD